MLQPYELYMTEEQPEAILIKGHSFIVAPNHFQMAHQSELRFPEYTEYRGSGHVMCCVVTPVWNNYNQRVLWASSASPKQLCCWFPNTTERLSLWKTAVTVEYLFKSKLWFYFLYCKQLSNQNISLVYREKNTSKYGAKLDI